VPDLPGLTRSLEDELTLLAKMAENATSRHGTTTAGGRHRPAPAERDTDGTRTAPRLAGDARPVAPHRPAGSSSTPHPTA